MSNIKDIQTISGLVFKAKSDVSILETSQKNNLNFEYSCKNGQCGVCKTSLLDGEVIELLPQLALSEEDKQKNKILTCCCAPKTDILIDAEDLSALQGIELKTLPARINNILQITGHIVEVELRLPPTASFNFLEGQFIDVIGPEGVRRSYSIANSTNEKTIKLIIKKVENGVLSQYWFNDVKENDLLRIEGPKGSFFYREPKKNIIFMATGTGIAPVKAILDKLSKKSGLTKDITIKLYWGNRREEDFFWNPNYASLQVEFIPVLSKAKSTWQGRVGYIQHKVIEDGVIMNETQVYACGSLQMIESAHKLLVENGLNDKQFYSDAFVSS